MHLSPLSLSFRKRILPTLSTLPTLREIVCWRVGLTVHLFYDDQYMHKFSLMRAHYKPKR